MACSVRTMGHNPIYSQHPAACLWFCVLCFSGYRRWRSIESVGSWFLCFLRSLLWWSDHCHLGICSRVFLSFPHAVGLHPYHARSYCDTAAPHCRWTRWVRLQGRVVPHRVSVIPKTIAVLIWAGWSSAVWIETGNNEHRFTKSLRALLYFIDRYSVSTLSTQRLQFWTDGEDRFDRLEIAWTGSVMQSSSSTLIHHAHGLQAHWFRE